MAADPSKETGPRPEHEPDLPSKDDTPPVQPVREKKSAPEKPPPPPEIDVAGSIAAVRAAVERSGRRVRVGSVFVPSRALSGAVVSVDRDLDTKNPCSGDYILSVCVSIPYASTGRRAIWKHRVDEAMYHAHKPAIMEKMGRVAQALDDQIDEAATPIPDHSRFPCVSMQGAEFIPPNFTQGRPWKAHITASISVSEPGALPPVIPYIDVLGALTAPTGPDRSLVSYYRQRRHSPLPPVSDPDEPDPPRLGNRAGQSEASDLEEASDDDPDLPPLETVSSDDKLDLSSLERNLRAGTIPTLPFINVPKNVVQIPRAPHPDPTVAEAADRLDPILEVVRLSRAQSRWTSLDADDDVEGSSSGDDDEEFDALERVD